MKPTVSDFRELLPQDSGGGDKHFYGEVRSINYDPSGKPTSYEVSLGGGSDTVTCRKLSGANIGDTVMVTLLKSGVAIVTGTVDGDADALEALDSASIAYEASMARRYTYYVYSESSSGIPLSFSDDSLPYRGICITTDTEAPDDPGMYQWEVNPKWASQHAEKYIHDVSGGLAIYSEDLDEDTYAGISALALTFYLAGMQQMKVGYDASVEEYGVIAKSLIALGSGAGVKFDNFGHSNTGARGRFTWEVRDNGHFSLKLY